MKRKEIIQDIIEALYSRNGFDNWWLNIDEDIQEEIKEELTPLLPEDIETQNTNF